MLTTYLPRRNVIPSSYIEHAGKYWLTSANTEHGLYIHRLCEVKRITDDFINVVTNKMGIK